MVRPLEHGYPAPKRLNLRCLASLAAHGGWQMLCAKLWEVWTCQLEPKSPHPTGSVFLVREEPKNITTRLDTIRLLDRGSFTSDFLAEDRPCCTFSSSPAIQRHKEGILLGGFNLQLHVLQCFAQCSGHSLTGSCFERPSLLLNVFYTEVTKCSNTAKQSETCPQVTCSQVFALQTTPSRLRASTD